MTKCTRVTRKVKDAARDLQDPKSTKKVKEEASKILNNHKKRNY